MIPRLKSKLSPPKNFIAVIVTSLLVAVSLMTFSLNLQPSEAAPAAPIGISFYPSGVPPEYRELYYPLLCGSKGTLIFAVNPPVNAIQSGVAIEVPREFSGLADGVTINVKSTITNNYTYVKVIDEARYYPYNMSAPFWVEVANPSGFSNLRYIFIEGLVAPSVASRYIFKCYYSFLLPTSTRPTAFEYSYLCLLYTSDAADE